MIDNPPFAAKVAAHVANEVRSLGFASEVHVRTFGNFDASSNTFAYEHDDLHPRAARSGGGGNPEADRGARQRWSSVANGCRRNNTNIIAFLDNAVLSIGCSGMPTTVILASDGIEDSEYARLDREDSRLPSPDGHPFSGCAELQILGVGSGHAQPNRNHTPSQPMGPLGAGGRLRPFPWAE